MLLRLVDAPSLVDADTDEPSAWKSAEFVVLVRLLSPSRELVSCPGSSAAPILWLLDFPTVAIMEALFRLPPAPFLVAVAAVPVTSCPSCATDERRLLALPWREVDDVLAFMPPPPLCPATVDAAEFPRGGDEPPDSS